MAVADALTPTTKEVLVIGNGFDIAQGLPTKYTDFMTFLRIPNLEEMIFNIQNGTKPEQEYEKFFSDPNSIDVDEIRRMQELRVHNSWVQYYLQCNAEIKGWIDLEHEMIPVFDFFKWLFNQKVRMTGKKDNSAHISTQDEEKYRMGKILPKFISLEGSSPAGTQVIYEMTVCSEYCDHQHGIFKEKILKTLKEDLDGFIEIFRIYLREIVCNAERKHNTIIDKIKADRIINFNYVQSEIFLANLKDAEVIHVHGDTLKQKNMVLGVNEIEEDLKKDFLFFTKSFQRIKIKSNPKYREFWEGSFNVTFFGHSLDITDIEIIKPLFDKAEHVIVYYYQDDDYEDKIINLIKLSDVQQIENDIYNGRLELLPSEIKKP